MIKSVFKKLITIISLFFVTESYSQSLLTVSINHTQPCYGLSNGSAYANVLGGTYPYTFLWMPSGATTQTISGLGPGNISVKVTDAQGDTATVQKTVFQFGEMKIQTSSLGYCAKNSGSAKVEINSFPDKNKYLWSDGQTTQIATELSGGNYTVTVTSQYSCTGTGTVTVTSFDSSVFISEDVTVCSGAYTGAFCSGGTSYLWNTGETSQSISFFATSTTTYSVTISKDTCSKVLQTNVRVSPFPITGFTANNTCFGTPVKFINKTVSVDSLISYHWIFGDGTYSTDIDPAAHNYSNPGTYYVSLYVKNKFGCQDSIVDSSIVINPIPISNFTGSAGCVNTPTLFTNQSTIPSGSIVNWNWNFGDQNSSVIQNPAHVFSSPGNFNVSLIVTSDRGCKDTSLKSVMVNGPTVNVKMKQDIVNPLLWYAQPTITGDAPFTYLWNFGDGNTSTLQYPVHNYDTAGHYAICLTVTDANGCVSTSCDSTYKLVAPGIIGQLIAISPVTAIEEEAPCVFSVYPNPTKDIVNGFFSKTIKGTVRMIDMTGREVLKQEINSNRLDINLVGLPAGLYSLMVTSDEYAINHSKILIKK